MVRLTGESIDPLGEIDRQSKAENDGPVLLVGVEEVFRASTEDAFLAALNLQRTEWPRRVVRPVVFWVPSWIVGDLLRGAPDFFDWRSDTLTFTASRAIDTNAELRHLHTGDSPSLGDSRLTGDERGRRIEELRSRIRIYEDTDDPATLHALARWLDELASQLQLVGEVDEALRIRRQAQLPVFERLDDERSRAVTFAKIADIYQLRGQLNEALRIRKQLLPAFERFGDERSHAITLAKIADIHQLRGDREEALRIRMQVHAVFEQLGDDRSRAVILGRIADFLQAQGQLNEALRIHQEDVLPVYERIGDERGRAGTFGSIAEILQAQGRLEDALRIHQQEELPVYERVGDVRARAVTLGSIADILQARGQLEDALRIHQQERLPAFERLGDTREQAVTLGRIAQIVAKRGDPREARRLQDERLQICRRQDDLEGITATLYDLAQLDLAADDRASALPRLAEAWQGVTALGQAMGIALVGHLFGLVLLGDGDFEQAREVLGRSHKAYSLLGRTAEALEVESLLAPGRNRARIEGAERD